MKYDIEKLKKYGFKLEKDKYILKHILDDNLYALFTIDKDINVKVYDKISNEEFIPFNLKTTVGSYVSDIRDKVDKIKKDIINNCFINNDTRNIIINYINQKYKIKEEHPWEEYKEYSTFKVNNKWFGLIMRIPYKSLGIESIEEVDVINVKIESDQIEKLVDNKNYFKAYHMNKKHWITIVLNYNTNMEEVKKLIDNSYKLVGGKYEG